jgi:hypothetical protein
LPSTAKVTGWSSLPVAVSAGRRAVVGAGDGDGDGGVVPSMLVTVKVSGGFAFLQGLDWAAVVEGVGPGAVVARVSVP